MKQIPTLLLCTMLFAAVESSGQTFAELEFGTDTTFEVATWNIEWFPKNGQTTVNYVSQIIEALDVDLIAMQELDDTDLFDQMMAGLDGYVGYYESSWFAGLAYIYKPDVVQINAIYEIYTTQPYWGIFPRSPVVMDLTYEGENIFVINNHYKCCGDGILEYGNTDDEEYRRYRANELLKQYIDTNLPNSKVIMLGDLNDLLVDTAGNNVFQMILNDTENYLFADLAIEQGPSSNWSYPSWPSHLDHILITNELMDVLENSGSAISTILVDDYFPGGWWGYDGNVSDHRPVAMRLDFSSASAVNTAPTVMSSLTSYPNPFNPKTVISFELSDECSMDLSIFNSVGQKVDVLVDTRLTGGHYTAEWDASGLPSGPYFAKLNAGGFTRTHKIMLVK